jgi:hypothetical protein
LRDEVILNYNSIEQLSSNLGAVKFQPISKIPESVFRYSEFGSTLRNTVPFNKYPNAVLNVNANVKGSVNDLLINNLKVSGLDQLRVAASGRTKMR